MSLNEKILQAELCVIGGGIAGTYAAITAARLGLKTVLIHERPVFGGNASGEIRMWICGAQQRLYKEAGLQEEFEIANYYFNPSKNHYLNDALLYRSVEREKNLTALLNCTCFAADTQPVDTQPADTQNEKIQSVTAYQMTTQTLYRVQAKYFADCSGDSILAPLTGAHYMYGREAAEEYGEHTERPHAVRDRKTMGNSLLMQARDVGHKVQFTAPDFAEKVSVQKLKEKGVSLEKTSENFWYIELGGNVDTIAEAETLNRRLLALCLGVWDTVKNSGEFNAENFDLEFLGFLPAKRESRRMKGDYVLTANDILSGGNFADTVAYGGWGLDDHNPDGFDGKESNYYQPVRGVYGIPYRCLYSENIGNLFFAGRNISATHLATSSARVMGTCGCIGQAVGAAAFVANRYGLLPRAAGKHIGEIQQLLLMRDCYLPRVDRKVSSLCKKALLTVTGNGSGATDAELLRDGFDRNTETVQTGVKLKNGAATIYEFETPQKINGVKIVFDSDFLRETVGTNDSCEKFHSTRCNILQNSPVLRVPQTLAKSFIVTGETADGDTVTIFETSRNLKRNVLLPLDNKTQNAYKKIALTVRENYGRTNETNVFTFEIY